MNLRQIKKEFFYIRKSFFVYKRGSKYLVNKYLTAKKILQKKEVIEKKTNNGDLSVHLLTCHRDMVMLLWSLASYFRSFRVFGDLHIHSDGTLTVGDKKILKKYFPSARIVDSENFVRDYAEALDEYPVISRFRKEKNQYVLLKKIIDPYFVSDKPLRLIIDSDLLWFCRPKEIEDAIERGIENPLMMRTRKKCPVFLRGKKFPEELSQLNSGIVLYKKKDFRPEVFSEYLNSIDESNPENRHFIEQAGYAHTLFGVTPLPEDRYIALGSVASNTVMRHYTSPRRALLYIEGIEKLLEIYGKDFFK